MKTIYFCLFNFSLLFVSLSDAAEAPVSFSSGNGSLRIKIGEEEVATYVYQDPKVPRPYFANVRTGSGQQVTRHHPPREGIDKTDHAGLHAGIWLSFGDLNGNDYWRLKAVTQHVEFLEPAIGGPGSGRFTVRNRYLTADGKQTVCEEICRHAITTIPEGYRIDYSSEFQAADTELVFGDQEEMGLGVRVATPLAVETNLGGRILDSAGRINGQEVWGQTASWCDYSGKLEGKWAGLTVLTGPKNFRPCWSHARDYGFFAMNPFGHKAFTKQPAELISVKPGEQLKLDYSVVVHESLEESKYDPQQVYTSYAQSLENAESVEPLQLNLHYQEETSEKSARYHRLYRAAQWKPEQTALIVCDMWDLHHCHRAVLRVKELAPHLEKVLQQARERGVTIIHAPSSCMESYADHPARQRAIDTPRVKSFPPEIDQWCYKISQEEKGTYPIDQSQGGEDDDPDEHEKWAAELTKLGRDPKAPWKSQYAQLTIDADRDYISDNGEEIWSILEQRGITNVILTGVHTNMCVLGRPFGLRRMVQAGKNTVLMSDMTDTMYDPRCSPFVSHFTGTDLIIDHIERHVCPTMTSDQLIGGQSFRFAEDQRPTIAILMAEDEYETEKSLPPWSIKHLGPKYRIRWIFSSDMQKESVPGIDAIRDADLLLVSARRRPLRPEQLDVIRAFAAAGKPMLGIRTASHAFSLRNGEVPAGTAAWPEFDNVVWGGRYTNHHGNQFRPTITPISAMAKHPILKGWGTEPFVSQGSLYMVSPLMEGAIPMLDGAISGQPSEPIAWTFQRKDGGRSFYTSLGHQEDFADPRFQKLLSNAVDWLIADK
jgi:nicotinamidase-related amidase/type 1 glutamine amidotransferase